MKQPIFFYFVHYADKHDEIIYSTYIHDKSCKLLTNFLQYYCKKLVSNLNLSNYMENKGNNYLILKRLWLPNSLSLLLQDDTLREISQTPGLLETTLISLIYITFTAPFQLPAEEWKKIMEETMKEVEKVENDFTTKCGLVKVCLYFQTKCLPDDQL